MSRTTKILVVTAIVFVTIVAILIIIPNLVPSKPPMGKGPVGSIRDINDGEMTYASNYPKIGFSHSLIVLGCGYHDVCRSQITEEHAGFIDPNLASGVEGGYRFTYAPVWDAETHTNIGYTVHADPIPQPTQQPNLIQRVFPPHIEKEQRHFFCDQSGIVRIEKGREARANSPALQ